MYCIRGLLLNSWPRNVDPVRNEDSRMMTFLVTLRSRLKAGSCAKRISLWFASLVRVFELINVRFGTSRSSRKHIQRNNSSTDIPKNIVLFTDGMLVESK